MEMIVTGRHIEVTAPIREHVESKASKLPRYFDRVTSIEVIIDKAERGQKVEVIVHAEGTTPFIVNITGDDLYHCIDEAVDKLERQLTDHKEKLRNRKHPPH